MLVLALLSIGLLAYETWGNPTAEQTRQIILADYTIIGIFALEFTVRWIRDDRPKTFVWRNWYDLLGMIPVAHPAIRGFRLFRIVRIVVLLSRFGRAADRAFGQEFVNRLLFKFKDALVDTVSGAVTIRVLDETEAVLMKGRYAKNLADAIDARGDEILKIVVEKVSADPKLGRVRHIPFFDDIVGTSSKITQRILVDLLRDDRMGEMIRDIIKQNIMQIRADMNAKEAKRKQEIEADMA
jgi:voltage-gated potassium channel